MYARELRTLEYNCTLCIYSTNWFVISNENFPHDMEQPQLIRLIEYLVPNEFHWINFPLLFHLIFFVCAPWAASLTMDVPMTAVSITVKQGNAKLWCVRICDCNSEQIFFPTEDLG